MKWLIWTLGIVSDLLIEVESSFERHRMILHPSGSKFCLGTPAPETPSHHAQSPKGPLPDRPPPLSATFGLFLFGCRSLQTDKSTAHSRMLCHSFRIPPVQEQVPVRGKA